MYQERGCHESNNLLLPPTAGLRVVSTHELWESIEAIEGLAKVQTAPTPSQAREINHNVGSINQRQTKIEKAVL